MVFGGRVPRSQVKVYNLFYFPKPTGLNLSLKLFLLHTASFVTFNVNKRVQHHGCLRGTTENATLSSSVRFTAPSLSLWWLAFHLAFECGCSKRLPTLLPSDVGWHNIQTTSFRAHPSLKKHSYSCEHKSEEPNSNIGFIHVTHSGTHSVNYRVWIAKLWTKIYLTQNQ